MYYILEFNSGQPVILSHLGNNLQKYTITSGRIFNKGTIIKDINCNFKLWDMSPAYISYESVDGSTVICQISADTVTEVFITKNLCTFLKHNNKLIMFYLESLPNTNTYALYAVTSDDFKEKTLICDNLDLTESISATLNNDYVIVFLNQKQLILSPDFKIITTVNLASSKNSVSINLQNEVSKLKFELHQLEQHHSDFVRQYEQLSAYTGELQEKLRKTRLHIDQT